MTWSSAALGSGTLLETSPILACLSLASPSFLIPAPQCDDLVPAAHPPELFLPSFRGMVRRSRRWTPQFPLLTLPSAIVVLTKNCAQRDARFFTLLFVFPPNLLSSDGCPSRLSAIPFFRCLLSFLLPQSVAFSGTEALPSSVTAPPVFQIVRTMQTFSLLFLLPFRLSRTLLESQRSPSSSFLHAVSF